ncbi:MAG: ABC transporter ATP-binding protein [Anaerolineae bacterium]
MSAESIKKVRLRTIEMRNIVKRFPGVVANAGVNFEVRSGEVHALLGENGAGKTTLMRMLYGLYQPDEGEILIDGRPIKISSPADAIRHGIGMVHQHFMLVPSLSVAANVALGLPSSRGWLTDLDRVGERVRELAIAYGLRVDPQALVWQLAVGEQQRVEILKTLHRGADLLILDEPTAVLTPQEVDELFITLRRMAQEGHSLIFISHKLHEVMSISDRVTVLRGGRVVSTLNTADTNRQELARLMVGREVLLRVEQEPVPLGPARLRLENLSVLGDKGILAVRDVSFEIRAGEILGIAGVSGNGQREMAEAITGLRVPTQGRVLVDGVDVSGWKPDRLVPHGVAHIPEERLREGAIKEFSVEENLMLEDHSRAPFARSIFFDFGKIAQHCDQLISDFRVKRRPARPRWGRCRAETFKMIPARELSRNLRY